MTNSSNIEVEYIHRLTEDIGWTLKAGIVLKRTASSDKPEDYSAWTGLTFVSISPEKVRVYKVTTTTIISVEEVI